MSIRKYLVSASGQLSLPAAARRRWGLLKGGPVDVMDLGEAVLIVPHGKAGSLVGSLYTADDHARFVAEIDDPDLRTT
jgi:bifunctional DNA-binding transcriptional regulator/antitoxin component of YhaV-PrlF toxin-antitoxin module